MSRANWINNYLWKYVTDYETREEIKEILDELPEEYVANIENRLRIRGEHELANRFVNDVDYYFQRKEMKERK